MNAVHEHRGSESTEHEGAPIAQPNPHGVSPVHKRTEPRWLRQANSIARLSAIAGGALCVVMAVNILADVVMRTAFARPLPATLELTAGWWMACVTTLGLAYAHARNDQIRITALVDRADPRFQVTAALIAEVVTLATVSWMLWLAIEKLWISILIGESSLNIAWVLLWPGRLVIVVSLAIFALSIVVRIVRLLIGTAAVVEVETFDVD